MPRRVDTADYGTAISLMPMPPPCRHIIAAAKMMLPSAPLLLIDAAFRYRHITLLAHYFHDALRH